MLQNNQVEEVTKILGTNTLGSVEIIENSASGTNYFAKVEILKENYFLLSIYICLGSFVPRCSIHLQFGTGCHLLFHQCRSSVSIFQQRKLEKPGNQYQRSGNEVTKEFLLDPLTLNIQNIVILVWDETSLSTLVRVVFSSTQM